MIRLATPVYNVLEPHLPSRIIQALNHLSTSHPNTTEQSLWKKLIAQMTVNTLIYAILSLAVTTLIFMFADPLLQHLLGQHWYTNALTGLLAVLLIAPFLRAMVMKKNHSDEFRALWRESNRNRPALIFTILVRLVIALSFVFYICQRLTHLGPALIITLGFVAMAAIIFSRSIKRRSILLERLFINNLRSRDIMAQVHGTRRPLYEGRLLDRDIHIADFDIPQNSQWAGQSLRELNLGHRYGVHVSSILRGSQRQNIPDGEARLYPLDRIQVIGSDEQLKQFNDTINKELLDEDPDIEKREMKLRQLIIESGSPFIGKTLSESGIRDKYNCMVVGLESGEESLSNVSPYHTFKRGDILWIVGEESNVALLKKES